MSDPQTARERAEAVSRAAADQLQQARDQDERVQRVSRVSKWLLDRNHLGELLEQALGVRR